VAAGALPPAAVLGVVGLAAAPWVVAVVFVVVAAALVGYVWTAGPRRAAAAIGGQPADPRAHARLFSLVEGLGVAAGVPRPRLVIIDSPAFNAVSVGRDPHHATLAVTAGLLEGLSRVELEAVVAEQLIRIKRLDTLAPTLAVAAGPLGRLALGTPPADTADDLEAVAVTRYPPGLAAALESIAGGGTTVPGTPPALSGLWLANPAPEHPGPRSAPAARSPLPERIQALREL
jgi:heat shock protein HtpX